MDNFLAVSQRLIPDLIVKMQRRFKVLEMIYQHQPIGRRALSDVVHLTERVLRTEIDNLKMQGLIVVDAKGMSVTEEGISVISQLSDYMNIYNGLNTLGTTIKNKYGLRKVIVVSGDLDQDDGVRDALGLEGARYLESLLRPGMSVTVTGGSTMANVASHLWPLDFPVLFTPARGGLGEEMSHQANMIVNMMAQKTGGTFEVLYVPDWISESTYHSLMKEPSIQSVLEEIKSAEIVIHGIGNAMKMAEKRKSSTEIMNELHATGAVGEAFGYYFDKMGKSVYKVRTIGLTYEDIEAKANKIAVAGGASKKEAILAYLKFAPKDTVLITDEAVAKHLI